MPLYPQYKKKKKNAVSVPSGKFMHHSDHSAHLYARLSWCPLYRGPPTITHIPGVNGVWKTHHFETFLSSAVRPGRTILQEEAVPCQPPPVTAHISDIS